MPLHLHNRAHLIVNPFMLASAGSVGGLLSHAFAGPPIRRLCKVPLDTGANRSVVHKNGTGKFSTWNSSSSKQDYVKAQEPGELYIMALYESRSEWSRAVQRAQGTSGGFCIITHYVTVRESTPVGRLPVFVNVPAVSDTNHQD